jgi:putative peptidoglycan lipid II flippase
MGAKPGVSVASDPLKWQLPRPAPFAPWSAERFAVWSIAFVYASLMGLAFQKLIVPMMPGVHAGHGLLVNDAIYFHEVAVDLAAEIAQNGWSSLLSGQQPGNVLLLATLYRLLGPDPAWFIPFGAGLHALSAMLLYMLGRLIWPGETGRWGGLLAATLFTMFPSSLQWYAQNHKDAFAIAGVLLILYAWFRSFCPDAVVGNKLMKIGVLALLGALLILFVRAYLLKLVLLGLFAAAGVALARLVWEFRKPRPSSLTWCIPILVVGLCTALTPPLPGGVAAAADAASQATTISGWNWDATPIVPRGLDNTLEKISLLRSHFAHSGSSAGSLVDGAVQPRDATEAIQYLPRALVVGLFAPFASSWADRPTPVRLVGAAETLVWYLLAPGVLLLLVRRSSAALVGALAFVAVVLGVLAYVQPVVGTLYRQRFGVWMFVALLGAVGWSRVLLTILHAAERAGGPPAGNEVNVDRSTNRATLTATVASGALVLMIWILTLLAFLFRDLILVHSHGLGADFGGFFSALMVPMFFHAFLSAPLADAMTSRFLSLNEAQRRPMVRALLGHATLILTAVGLALIVYARPLVAFVMSGADAATVDAAAMMLRWCTPFVVCSAWTVIGGAVLNLNGRALHVALGQLSTPVIAILVILFYQETQGVFAAIFGMLAGVGVNTAVVAVSARNLGFSLIPSFAVNLPAVWSVFGNLLPLSTAALFAGASVPMNYAFAGSISVEALSTWALGSKLVQVVATTAGFAMGAVVLPHLGKLVAGRLSAQLSTDSYFLMVAGSWIAATFCLAVQLLADAAVATLLSSKTVTLHQAATLATVLRIGALQLPFVVISAFVIKLAAVSGVSWRAMFATAIGLGTNVVGDLLLAPSLGVIGIASAATAGACVCAVTMVLLTRCRANLSAAQLLTLLATWGGCLALSLSVVWHTLAVAVVVLLALSVVAWLQWQNLSALPKVSPN